MDEGTMAEGTPLSRGQVSAAVSPLGWRFVLGTLTTQVEVDSMARAAAATAGAVAACGADADAHLRLDVRPDRVILTLRTFAPGGVTAEDVRLAGAVSAAVGRLGLHTSAAGRRSVQLLEIAIDAMEISAVRPFWQAVMAYADEGGTLVDPLGQGPPIWFQQMDAPRPQRNRIHLDISVPHDEAPQRIRAALAAGGRLLSDARAPSFWVLADVEGNEACVTTWQGRE